MSPVSLSFNPEHTRHLDRAVRKIDVNSGSLIATETDSPIKIAEGESKEFDNVASLTLYSPDGATTAIYYFDEPEGPIADPGHLEYNVERAEQERDRVEDQNRPTEIAEAKVHQAKRELETATAQAKKTPKRSSTRKASGSKKSSKRAGKPSKSTSRGDSGGTSGSYDSRTVTELRDLAKDRGLTVKGKKGAKPVKADYVKALRKGK